MKIAVIGAGTIGKAIIERLLSQNKGLEITATNLPQFIDSISYLEERGVRVTSDNRAAVSWSDLTVLTVKPGNAKAVLGEVREAAGGKLILSFMAAVPLSTIQRLAPETRFIRAMTNIAVLVGEAFTAYSLGDGVTREDEEKAIEVFKAMGKYTSIEEKHLDAVTGLSGSCPAYILSIIEAFMYAGLKVGLPREFSLYSSAQSVLGAAKLVLETKRHPAELKDMVVTPGGTTIDGIYRLEEGLFRTAIMNAVEAATIKAARIVKAIDQE